MPNLLSQDQPQVDDFHSLARHDGSMTIIQLLITGVAIVGVIVIVLLAIIPSLLDYPRGRDNDESSAGTDPLSQTIISRTHCLAAEKPSVHQALASVTARFG